VGRNSSDRIRPGMGTGEVAKAIPAHPREAGLAFKLGTKVTGVGLFRQNHPPPRGGHRSNHVPAGGTGKSSKGGSCNVGPIGRRSPNTEARLERKPAVAHSGKPRAASDDPHFAAQREGRLMRSADVVAGTMLAHKRGRGFEGVEVAEIFSRSPPGAGHVNLPGDRHSPSVVYTTPELSSVGKGPRGGAEAGRPWPTSQAKYFPFTANGRFQGQPKPLTDVKDSRRCEGTDGSLGAHIVGRGKPGEMITRKPLF